MAFAQSEFLTFLKNCEKLAQQIDTRAHLAHHYCLVSDLVFMQSGGFTRDTQKWPLNITDLNPVDSERVYQKPVRNVVGLKQRLIAAWSGIQQSVIDQAIDQRRDCLYACVSKPKANILNICCGVFVHTVNFHDV